MKLFPDLENEEEKKGFKERLSTILTLGLALIFLSGYLTCWTYASIAAKSDRGIYVFKMFFYGFALMWHILNVPPFERSADSFVSKIVDCLVEKASSFVRNLN